ncbi:MAG: hypothetical protein IJ632_04860 [Muribaculaceae bacterium]|nr:hypothetical protein [Muribaculaceae bacterium]
MRKSLLSTILAVVAFAITASAQTVNFDFAANEWNHPLGTSLNRAKGYITAPIEKDGVSIVFKYGTATSRPYYIETGPQVRVLNKNVMKIYAPQGKAITKIAFTHGNYFNLKADGLAGDEWTGNAALVKFTGTGSSYIDAIAVTLEDMNENTAIPTEDDEVVTIDFDDPTQHSEFNVVENTPLTADLDLEDADEGGESRLYTHIPFTNSTSALVSKNALMYQSYTVKLRMFNGAITFSTDGDKVIKSIEMSLGTFNSGNTLNGEPVTKAELTAGKEVNAPTAELAIAGQTIINTITVTLADKPVEPYQVPTAISEIAAGEKSGPDVIYDLSGRRLRSIDAAGIYIVNGKKVLVK